MDIRHEILESAYIKLTFNQKSSKHFNTVYIPISKRILNDILDFIAGTMFYIGNIQMYLKCQFE